MNQFKFPNENRIDACAFFGKEVVDKMSDDEIVIALKEHAKDFWDKVRKNGNH